MTDRPFEILLVEDDEPLAEMLERQLRDVLGTPVTAVPTTSDALREELTTRHDIIIISMDLPGDDGLTLVRRIRGTNPAPVVLISETPAVDDALAAIRLGVAAFLQKPFAMTEMTETLAQIVEAERKRQHERRRMRRLRKLASRIVRERRDLRKRLDLICRDFVHAYRRLAERVAASQLLREKVHE